MNIVKKLCCVTLVFLLFLTGCSNSGNTSNSAKAPTQSSSAGQSQTTAASNSQTSTVITGAAPGKIVINQSKTAPPIRASQIFISKGVIYYISPINNEISYMNLSSSVQYSTNNQASSGSASGAVQVAGETASEIMVVNNTIYYTNLADGNKIYSISVTGTNKTKLVDDSASNMIMIGVYIYYINGEGILTVLDTSSGIKYSLGIKANCFDSDGTVIYYETANNTLNSVQLDGSGDLPLSSDCPTSIAVQNGNVFYANGNVTNALYDFAIGTGNTVELANVQAEDLQYSNGWIYYKNAADMNNIYKIKPNGSGNIKVIDDPFVTAFAVNNGTIYFFRSIDRIDNKDTIYKTAA